jgi:acetoin utilization protein AcuB
MFAKELVTQGIAPIDNSDSGEFAILRMHEYNVNQLPVVEAEKYIGIISMDEVVSLNRINDPVRNILTPLRRPFVYDSAHLFEVMKIAIEYNVKVVPVLGRDEKYIGLITAESCIRAFAKMQSVMSEGGIIQLSVPVKDFQLSEIARIVESNHANILSFYSQIDADTAVMEVTLKVNTTELSAIIASFERYEYDVKGVFRDENYEEEVKDRYDALMRYLDV